MKRSGLFKGFSSVAVSLPVIMLLTQCNQPTGQTEIARWQYDRNGAVSITYDDGSINQFRKAVPIMNRLNIPGTFFINTGSVPGSTYQGKFIGRPVTEIIKETRTVPTGADNFLERASAARYIGYKGSGEYFTRAGARMDADKPEEAWKIIDELYQKVNKGELQKVSPVKREDPGNDVLTWDMIREYVSQGHEFASHMVTHPYVAALDEVNLMYELEKSRDEILEKLGPRYTFSAECPYGTENERAMEYAHKIYPALRNRMPEKFLDELNRSSKKSPVNSDKEYVQWQRGATTKTPLPVMKAWVDTTATMENIWLVLVIHGIDGIGWEALTSESVDEYFQYIKSKEDKLWVATFADATKYMRERMNADIKSTESKGKIIIELTHSLDKSMYDIPLTLKTYVRRSWKEVSVQQGENSVKLNTEKDEKGTYVMYLARPNTEAIEISAL